MDKKVLFLLFFLLVPSVSAVSSLNLFTLDGLYNVNTESKANGQILAWNSSSSKWENANIGNVTAPVLSAYVPYTGATSAVNLGAQSITTTGTGTFGSGSSSVGVSLPFAGSSPPTWRGGHIQFQGPSAAHRYIFMSPTTGRIGFSNAVQSAVGDYGKAWIDADDGSASFTSITGVSSMALSSYLDTPRWQNTASYYVDLGQVSGITTITGKDETLGLKGYNVIFPYTADSTSYLAFADSAGTATYQLAWDTTSNSNDLKLTSVGTTGDFFIDMDVNLSDNNLTTTGDISTGSIGVNTDPSATYAVNVDGRQQWTSTSDLSVPLVTGSTGFNNDGQSSVLYFTATKQSGTGATQVIRNDYVQSSTDVTTGRGIYNIFTQDTASSAGVSYTGTVNYISPMVDGYTGGTHSFTGMTSDVRGYIQTGAYSPTIANTGVLIQKSNDIIIAGTPALTQTGIKLEGWNGGYASATKYGILADGGRWVLKADGSETANYIGLGAADDARIYYDGTNLAINPKSVGTGFLNIKGNINATSGYFQNITVSNSSIHFEDGTGRINNLTTSGDKLYFNGEALGQCTLGDIKMSTNSDETDCWKVADGTDGTIDLTDKFVIGAGNTYAAGNTGGEASHDHTVSSETDSGTASVSAGYNTIDLSTESTDSSSVDLSSEISDTVSGSSIGVALDGTGAGSNFCLSGADVCFDFMLEGDMSNVAGSIDDFSVSFTGWNDVGSHSHGVTSWTNVGSHDHTVTDSGHTHSYGFTTDSENNLPPFYALVYKECVCS